MTPSVEPERIQSRTVFASGRTLSRLGPMTPLTPAAARVWHEPQFSAKSSFGEEPALWTGGGGAGAVGWTTSVDEIVSVLPPSPQPATATTSRTPKRRTI